MYAAVDRGDIIQRFEDKGILLTSHGFERIISENLSVEEIIAAAEERGVWIIADEFLQEFIDGKKKMLQPVVEVERKGIKAAAAEIDSDIKILEETEVTNKSSCEGVLEDFVEYFNKKYSNLSSILKEREILKTAVPINIAKKNREQDFIQMIVMVSEKRESKKGYCFLEVEDPTGELTVMVPAEDARMRALFDQILNDEVIGISGKFRNDMFIANELFQPDLPLDHKAKTSEDPVSVAFLSDTHVGSYLFLEKEFNRFIDCMNLKGSNPEIFEHIKYVLIAGDLVDGIGIYPTQEKELSIPDIYKQYDFLAKLLEKLPDYVEVILSMGNHDAVRGAEPQPRLDKDIGAPLYDLPNVHVVGNPVSVLIHGVRVLMYHGTSLDTIIGSVPGCSYTKPESAMAEYLKRRYLVPSYGNDAILPEREDYLVIKDIPDILHSGHVHTNGYAVYHGVRIINSGTWQARTKYQEELGHIPTPARVPVMNLQNYEVSVIHFRDE